MLTLNQIVSQITNLAAAHSQIAESGVGDFAEWQAKERSYPILWVFHESTSVNQMEIAFSIRLICADRVIVGEEGDNTEGHEQEVLSDTLLVLLDFLAYFQQNHSQPYNVVTSATIDPFTERLNDRLAGNSVTIQIRQPFDWNKCQIPQTGASIPPSVDGLTLYNFCDPSVVARLTDAQRVCLEAAICEAPEPCADATITVNTSPFGTAPSGGSLNVPVVNGGANAVGSIIAGEVMIANNATFINGTQVTDQEAEVDANIFVTLNGTQAGTWNAMTQTWEVTGVSCGSVSVAVSDATPNFGDTITITATPTNYTPTSYLFFAFDGSSVEFIAEQAGNVVNWSVTLLGAFDIYALGTDGATETFGTVSAMSTGDPDASAFIIAAGITDNIEKSAVTTLTLALKAASLYTKFIAVYPLLGGTANSHKYNLIDPQDTDLAHRLTFSGGWTHTSNGARGNASNTYANTHIIPNALLTSGSNSVGFYTRSNVSENKYDFACSTDAGAGLNPFGAISWYTLGSVAYYMSGNYNLSAAVGSAGGLTHGFGNAGTWRLYRNGAQIGSTASSSITLPNFALYLGGNNGGGTLSLVSSKEYAFAFVADQQMTPTDAVNLYAIVQAYQTTLNRQV